MLIFYFEVVINSGKKINERNNRMRLVNKSKTVVDDANLLPFTVIK